MAHYTKVGLLVLDDSNSKFLVTEVVDHDGKRYWLMPGGQPDHETDMECLIRQILDEIVCQIDVPSLEYIGIYEDAAASWKDRDVLIKLYRGNIIGTPEPSHEVTEVRWIGKEDLKDERNSAVIRNKIMPDLIRKGILL